MGQVASHILWVDSLTVLWWGLKIPDLGGGEKAGLTMIDHHGTVRSHTHKVNIP